MPERSTYLSESKILPENKWPRLPFGKHSKVDGYSPEYLARKAQVQTEFVTLSSGVKWAYFQEGDRSGVPLLCLHGGGESKWMWLQKEPIPGVWMIALDRPGYGDSGDPPMKQVEYTFEHILKDIGEFCDKLGIDQFVPCGFSIGTSWAMQTAVYYPKRVRGIILFGTMADTGHPDCPKKLVSKIGKPPKIMDPNGGCLGFILRGAFSGPCKEYQKYNFSAPIKDDAKDPRCATRFQEWMNDPFWVAMKVDDCLGFNRPEALLGDAYRTLFGAWPYDIKQIKCPVYIYPSSFDVDMGSTNPHATTFLKMCMPHAIVEEIPGGLASTVDPGDAKCGGGTQARIVKAVKEMPPL